MSWKLAPLISVAWLGLLALMASADDAPVGCAEDTMIVFDASGSMGGTDLNTVTPRIAKVRDALAKVLPEIDDVRPLGLMVYGPGGGNTCKSTTLKLKPALHAAAQILDEVNRITPAGNTPLTAAVEQAAEVLEYKRKRGTILLITDGEETCGGNPCNAAGLLKAKAVGLTIHVIGYKDPNVVTGAFGARCMADMTAGKYIAVATTDELVKALRAMLGCPDLTRLTVPQSRAQSSE